MRKDKLGEAGKNKVPVILDRVSPIGEATPDAQGTGDMGQGTDEGPESQGNSHEGSLHLQMGGICRIRSNALCHQF
jgi:hypothetical protein